MRKRCWRSPGCPSLSRLSSPGCPAEVGRTASGVSASLLPGGEPGRRGYGSGSTHAADSAGGKKIHLFGKINGDENKINLIPKFDVRLYLTLSNVVLTQ